MREYPRDFEVIIQIEKRSCTCLRYFDEGIPYQRMICVGNKNRRDLLDLISPTHHKATFVKTISRPGTPFCPEPGAAMSVILMFSLEAKRNILEQLELGEFLVGMRSMLVIAVEAVRYLDPRVIIIAIRVSKTRIVALSLHRGVGKKMLIRQFFCNP